MARTKWAEVLAENYDRVLDELAKAQQEARAEEKENLINNVQNDIYRNVILQSDGHVYTLKSLNLLPYPYGSYSFILVVRFLNFASSFTEEQRAHPEDIDMSEYGIQDLARWLNNTIEDYKKHPNGD